MCLTEQKNRRLQLAARTKSVNGTRMSRVGWQSPKLGRKATVRVVVSSTPDGYKLARTGLNAAPVSRSRCAHFLRCCISTQRIGSIKAFTVGMLFSAVTRSRSISGSPSYRDSNTQGLKATERLLEASIPNGTSIGGQAFKMRSQGPETHGKHTTSIVSAYYSLRSHTGSH